MTVVTLQKLRSEPLDICTPTSILWNRSVKIPPVKVVIFITSSKESVAVTTFNSSQLFITLLACEKHSTSNLICKNYELMKKKTFHFDHGRLNNTELLNDIELYQEAELYVNGKDSFSFLSFFLSFFFLSFIHSVPVGQNALHKGMWGTTVKICRLLTTTENNKVVNNSNLSRTKVKALTYMAGIINK